MSVLALALFVTFTFTSRVDVEETVEPRRNWARTRRAAAAGSGLVRGRKRVKGEKRKEKRRDGDWRRGRDYGCLQEYGVHVQSDRVVMIDYCCSLHTKTYTSHAIMERETAPIPASRHLVGSGNAETRRAK